MKQYTNTNRRTTSLHYIYLLLMIIQVFTLLAFQKTSPAYAEEKVQKQYGIMVADDKGGYTFYNMNTSTDGIAAIESNESGSVMVPLKELAALMPILKYSYDGGRKTATVTNTRSGKRLIYTLNSQYVKYYASSRSKAVKKKMVSSAYRSERSSTVMVHMQSLKWIMAPTSGFVFYKPQAMQEKGYDTYTYSGLILYNAYNAIDVLPAAPKVYGIPSTVKVTIPEGYSVAQIFNLLVKKGICTSTAALYDAMENYEFNTERYPLYAAIEENDNRCFKLEGYLYPDTYEFNLLSKPQDVIGKFLRNTEAKITSEDRQKAKALGYSMDQIITVASMIEKEIADKNKMPDIAAVIYNRLNIKMKLRFDSSIYYVERYIKPYISGDINRYNSYYNTYKCSALPASPICNPGKAALQAALNPSNVDYLYFYSDSDGAYHFSKEWVNPKANSTTATEVLPGEKGNEEIGTEGNTEN